MFLYENIYIILNYLIISIYPLLSTILNKKTLVFKFDF